ncbi:protein of unknown function [Candidatus Filomicrobium marinum]|nr:protein of unknown function [Candidatus Filomicrobium marinum]
MEPLRLEQSPRAYGLRNALLGQVRVTPPGEQITAIPLTLAVSDEHEDVVHLEKFTSQPTI